MEFDVIDSSNVFIWCQGIAKDLAQVSQLVKIYHSYYALKNICRTSSYYQLNGPIGTPCHTNDSISIDLIKSGTPRVNTEHSSNTN